MALKNEEEEGVDFELLNVFTTCPTDKDHSYSYHSDVISINDINICFHYLQKKLLFISYSFSSKARADRFLSCTTAA